MVAYRILVSSQGPLVLGFLGLGLRGLGPGLDNKISDHFKPKPRRPNDPNDEDKRGPGS